MTKFFSTVALALALTGCGHAAIPTSQLPAARLMAASAATQVAPTLPTGVGNTFSFERLTGGRGGVQDLHLTYTDRTGYFQGARTLVAPVVLHEANGTALELGTVTLYASAGQPDVYTGDTTAAILGLQFTSAELAFSNGQAWDSDNGHNYFAPLQ